MKELYFINLVGNLSIAVWVLFSVICVAIFVIGIAYFMEDIKAVDGKRLLKSNTIVAVVCLVLGIVVPTKKDLYIIYGVGSAVDYLQENEEAKRLPDNTIKALNAFAEKYAKEEE